MTLAVITSAERKNITQKLGGILQSLRIKKYGGLYRLPINGIAEQAKFPHPDQVPAEKNNTLNSGACQAGRVGTEYNNVHKKLLYLA